MANVLVDAMKKFLAVSDYRSAYDCLANLYEEEGADARRYVLAFRNALKGVLLKGYKADMVYDILHDTYVLTAKDSFDDFMIAVEWFRRDEDKFWLVRREQLLPVCEALESLLNDDLDELFLSMPPRVGKALANDTPILTRNGWKNHGDLVVGDEVIGMDGKFKKVLAVHPKCQLDVMVEFTNGEKIQCHENHEWLFYDRAKQRNTKRETWEYEKQKLESGTPGKRGHRYRFQVPYHDYVVGEKKQLAIDPYTLGVWLGDGVNTNPTICGDSRDYAIIEKIQGNGNTLKWFTRHKDTGVMYYGFDFRKKLQLYGMCHSHRRTVKHIPDEYLTASKEQRLELLAGLLDTDGTLIRKEHRYHFTTAEEPLRDSFVQLIATFGWRCSVQYYPPILSTSGIQGKHGYWSVGFCPDCYIPCVLERKQLGTFSKRRMYAVKSITRVEPKEGNCITVEGDGMYLAGNQMIPTHNTTIIMFFTIWYMNKFPDRSNLYASFSDTVAKTFYNGILEVMGDPFTYDLSSVFPKNNVKRTDSKDLLIDINRKKRYASLTCRSIDGTLNGSCDAEGLLVADDLHSGIDEARSKDQLAKKWETVRANFLSRKKGTAKILWIGTHWSLTDCISQRIEMLTTEAEAGHIRYKVVNVPALDEKDESNFDYLFHKGFTTEDYKAIRASYESTGDMALWLAPYQGTPIERDGAVFDPQGLKYYNGELPKEEPDRIFMAVDPAWGGGDYVAAPVIYQYDYDLYVHDVVFNNGDKYVTEPLVVSKAIDNNVAAMYVEATRVTSGYAEDLDKRLRGQGYRLNMISTTKHWSSQNGKKQRIFDKAPEIRERFIFRDARARSKEYTQFMNNMFSFTMEGKNKHDDAPDSLAMVLYNTATQMNKIQLMSRRSIGA